MNQTSGCNNSDVDLDVLISLINDEQDEDQPSAVTSDLKQNSGQQSKQNTKDLEIELKALQERMQLLQQQLTERNSLQTKTTTDLAPKLASDKKKIKEINIFDKPSSVNDAIEDVCDSSSKKSLFSQEKEKLFGSDVDTSDEEQEKYPLNGHGLNEFGKFIKKRLAHQPTYNPEDVKKKSFNTPPAKKLVQSLLPLDKNENTERDVYSNIRIKNPLLSSTTMKQRMEGRRMIRMSLMHLHVRGGDIEGDWVTVGVIVSKVEPKTSSKGNTYSIWKLNDLQDCSKLVSFFLFGKVHQQLWKTQVGSVVGILNPSIMPNRDSQSKNELTITVDNPQKIMLMGTAKDLGICKGRRKDGRECSMFINKSVCLYCPYHVQSEYRKVSKKRAELQSSYSGPEPNAVRQKILKNQQIMYGGQLYTSPSIPKAGVKAKKNQLILNPKLQMRADNVEKEILLETIQNKKRVLSSDENKCIQANVKSESLSEMLSIPSIGARNLIKHFTKQEKCTKDNSNNAKIQVLPPGALLKQHNKELMKQKRNQQCLSQQIISSNPNVSGNQASSNSNSLSNTPKLGVGLMSGDDIFLDVDFSTTKITPPSKSTLAKLKAIAAVRSKGPLTKVDPNAVKKVRTPEVKEKVMKLVDLTLTDSSPTEEPQAKRQKVVDVDIHSTEFRKILDRKSIHSDFLNAEEAEKQEKYFNHFEQKEQLEIKMSSITEIKCNVVSCKTCKYTAFSASELCSKEGHPLLYHKGTKRFFKCKNCKQRTVSLNKIPIKPCRQCGENNYERTSMWKEKTGPLLENEQLSLRGDEVKFLGSLRSDRKFLNL